MLILSELKSRRKRLGLTQIAMAREVGVSLPSYHLWENGGVQPNEENRRRLEAVLAEHELR